MDVEPTVDLTGWQHDRYAYELRTRIEQELHERPRELTVVPFQCEIFCDCPQPTSKEILAWVALVGGLLMVGIALVLFVCIALGSRV